MERYHIFKLGLAILFYAAYCIRPMLVNGLRYNDLAQNNGPKQVLRPEDYDVYYQGVDGTPGVDFPVLSYIPRTTFSCREIESGYYADLDTDCQVFHICEEGRKISFLCPNGTVFDQSDLICEWWYKVNCTNSPNLYEESAEQLKEDLARRKASRRVSLDGHEVNHGAVMRIEESSSVSAKQNGRHLEVSSSVRNTVTANRINGQNTERSHSSSPLPRAINNLNANQNARPRAKKLNDAQTGNYVNNVNENSNKNLKEYHLQFSSTSPGLDTASSEKLQHVQTRSTTPSSLANSFLENSHKQQSNINRGSIKYNSNFGDDENYSHGSTLIPSNEYDLAFPKHKSQVANGNPPQDKGAYIRVEVNKVDPGNKPKPRQKSTVALNRNDIITRRLEPTDSDELQVPQETAAFVTNSYNSIQSNTRKHSTDNIYPNHRPTYSDLKQTQTYFASTKSANGINSVTPQYITTQSINNGKPFIGSTVGVKIFNGNAGQSTPSPEVTTRSSFASATIQPANFITSISPLEEGNTQLAQIFASTFQPSISSTTKRPVDRATVYGTFSKSSTTTPLPSSNAEIRLANGANKVSIHLAKSVGGTATPPRVISNIGQNTLQTNGTDFVSITVAQASPKVNTKVGKNSLVTSSDGGTTFRPSYFQSTTVASKFGTGNIETVTPSVDVYSPQNVIGSTLVPGTRFNSAATVYNGKNSDGRLRPVPESPGSSVGISHYSSTVLPTNEGSATRSSSSLLPVVPEKTRPYLEGNKSGPKSFEDNPTFSNSVLPSFSPAFSESQNTGIPVPSSEVDSDMTIRDGKNFGSRLEPSVATRNPVSPNILTLQAENTPVSVGEVNNFPGPSSGTVFGSATAIDSAPHGPILPNSSEKDHPASSKGKPEYGGTIIPSHIPPGDFAQTTTLGTFSSSTVDSSKFSFESSTTTPTRATYLPKANSTSHRVTTEVSHKYSNSVILPPHLPDHTSANVQDLDGTGAFIPVQSFNSSNTNELNVPHHTIRSTVKPYTASHSQSNNFRTTQGFLTTVNPIGEGGASSSSGFYVTKNSVYGPSTASPFALSATSNYKEPTPVVNVSPNSGERDFPQPQITLSTPKFDSSFVLSKSETKWPRPFQKSPNSLDQSNEPVTPKYLNYEISSARPFKLPEGQPTPAPTLPTPFTTAAIEVSSVYENVDNMINVLKEIVNAKEQDYSAETPRPGLVIPPSAGPQTLHTLAVYFANALDGIAAERERLTGEELDDESKEKLTSLLTQMTMYRYKELFKEKEAGKVVESATTAEPDDILKGEDSAHPIETPALRQLARNFSLALSSYLDDPEAFRRDLENMRPTEPPPLSEDGTEVNVGEEELLNFSDADSKSSFPPVFPTSPSVSPTWGYIIASKPQADLDLSNSLNPDLNTADTQSFVPRYNNVAVTGKSFEKGGLDSKKDLPQDHWTTSPSVTKLWQSTLSINPVDLNEHFETTESIPHTTEFDFSAPGSLHIPHTEVKYDLRALPQLSLNSTQVRGILIDFMNTTKADETNRLQRLLKKLNTTEGEFLDRMKEIESNPLTKRLILLLISECGANATKDLPEHSAHYSSEEILQPSHSSAAGTAYAERKSLVNSDIPTLVDPSLPQDDQDTRALQLLNSLYTIASKFGK